jgi:hypothetical protein
MRNDIIVPATPACGLYKERMVHKPMPKGRRCLKPRCDTILSRYNMGHYCSIHEEPQMFGHLRKLTRWREPA